MVNGRTAEMRLIYLLVVMALLFSTVRLDIIGGLLALQAVLWGVAGLGGRRLYRALRRLIPFFVVIALSYGFLPVAGGGSDHWLDWPVAGWTIHLNLTGLALAGLMCLRVLVLVMASAWVRESGGPGDFIIALRAFRVPEFLALSIDGSLHLVTGSSRDGGRRSGAGGGRKRTKQRGGLALGLQQLRRGRLAVVRELFDHALRRGELFVTDRHPGLDARTARDVAVIIGVAGAIMSLKLVQLFPGLPVAPGHKNVLIVPFLLMAAALTRARFGGLWAGLTTGVVSVLMGYGKYGVLEIAPFAVPGLLADLLLPFAAVSGRRGLALLRLAVIGALIGAGRFAANFLVILLAGAPGVAFILYLPMLVSQVAFGALSAFVSLALLTLAEASPAPDSL